MAFSTKCEECGKLALGAFTKLKTVNGRALCTDCASSHTALTDDLVEAAGIKFPAGSWICESCHKVQPPVAKQKGSAALELILWLLFILPGVVYSLWRRSTRRTVCPSCHGHILPIASPRAQALVAKYF